MQMKPEPIFYLQSNVIKTFQDESAANGKATDLPAEGDGKILQTSME